MSPDPVQCRREQDWTIYDFDLETPSQIRIDVLPKSSNSDYFVIDKIMSGQIQLHDIDRFCVYHTARGPKKTSGWLDEAGHLVIKFHTNPLSQNYLCYLLSSNKSHGV